MSEYQQMIDDMIALLAADAEADQAELSPLHDRYTTAVKAVNRRLRECGERLRSGRRSEAIHLCEAEPNLLESVGILDFPEREVWADYIGQLGMPAPPELLIELAGEISEAYSNVQPLTSLLRMQRLHALARSPLPVRITILRNIARRDKENPAWEADVRAYERVRFEQISHEAAEAARRANLRCLAALEQELRSSDWLEKPNSALFSTIAKLHTQLRVVQTREELKRLANELNAAHADLDLAHGRKVREKWRTCAVIGIESPQDPLVELVAPAMEWLRGEDEREAAKREYDAALTALEHILDEGGARDDLERLYHAVARHECGLPPVLQKRVVERLRYLELAEKRRSRLMILGIALGVVILAAATGATLFFQLQRREIAAHAAALTDLVEADKLAEAETYLKNLTESSPQLLQNAKIQKLQGELAAALAKERERKKQLAELCGAAEDALNGEVAWDSLEYSAGLLQEADKLVKGDAEAVQVKQLELKQTNNRSRLQNEVDDLFKKELADLRVRSQEVEPADSDALRDIQQKAKKLQNVPHVSAELRQQVAPVLGKLASLQKQQMESVKEASCLAEVTAAIGNCDRYGAAMQTYAKEYPEHARSLSFRHIAEKEIKVWEGLGQWDALLRKWTHEDFRRITPAQATALLAEAKKLLDVQKGYPGADAIKGLVPHLEAVANRVDSTTGESIVAKLNTVLNNPTVRDLYMIAARDGKRYYLQNAPTLAGNKWAGYYLTGFDLTDKKRISLVDAEIANAPLAEGFDWMSPQGAFSSFAMDRLAELSKNGWETTFHAIIADLYKRTQMEPLLKVQILRHALAVACQGSHCLANAFANDLATVQNAPLDEEANWIAPDDAQAQTARVAAQRVLVQLRDPQEAFREAGAAFAKLNCPSMSPRYRWVGWLYQPQHNVWKCMLAKTGRQEADEVFVVYRLADDQPVRAEKIGRFSKGELVIASPAQTALREGRPVFVLETDGSRPTPRLAQIME